MSSENGRLVERDPQDTGRHSLQSVGEISLSASLQQLLLHADLHISLLEVYEKRFCTSNVISSVPHLLVSGGGDVLGKLRRRLGGARHLRVRQQQLVVSRLQKIQQCIGLP